MLVLENFDLKLGKTKELVAVLKNLNIDKTAIIVTKENNENVIKASGNLKYVDVTTSNLLNVYDIVACDKLLLTVDAVKSIEEAYKVTLTLLTSVIPSK